MDRSSIIHGEGALLFSVSGRGTSQLFDRLGYSGRKATEFTRGMTYPEEVDFSPEDLVSESGLSPDWDTTLQPAVFAAPIQRDKRAKLVAAFTEITGKVLDPSFTGTEAQWKQLATENDILLTKVDETTHVLKPYMWFHGASKNYVIVDAQGIPLQVKKTMSLLIKPAQLPATVRMWMDENVPT